MARNREEKEINRFREMLPRLLMTDMTAGMMIPSHTTDVYLYVVNTADESNRLLFTCIDVINSPDYDEGNLQLCAYYASCILTIYPGMLNTFTKVLQELGARVITHGLDHLEQRGITIHGGKLVTTALVVFGQLAILPYKTISAQSYDRYMDQRIQALKSRAGMAEIDDRIKAAELGVASVIRRKMGAHHLFRRELLMSILYTSQLDSMIGYVCGYLVSILAWTEMAGLKFISDALLRTSSPVLRDSRVVHEVDALYRAMKEVCADDMPQFFRITASVNRASIVERAKFPILMAVAQNILGVQQRSINQFVSSVSGNSQDVADLVALHREHMASVILSERAEQLAYLANFDDMIAKNEPALNLRFKRRLLTQNAQPAAEAAI